MARGGTPPAAHADLGFRCQNTAARGILLAFIFYVHALYMLQSGHNLPLAQLQLKLLAPNITLFFILSGMNAGGLLTKSPEDVLKGSLFLYVLAAASHALTAVVLAVVSGTVATPAQFLHDLIRPILLGTGYANYVSWFFVVLATTRLIVYGLARYTVVTVGALFIGTFALWIGSRIGAPDNIGEWRNLPASVAAFWIGMRIPGPPRVPLWTLPVVAALGGLALLANAPGILSRMPCLDCDPTFIASPMVGSFGSVPVYAIGVGAVFLLLVQAVRWLEGRTGWRLFHAMGHASVQLLVLHGWLLVSAYMLAATYLPRHDHPAYYVAVAAGTLVLNLGAYRLLRRPVNRFVRWCYIVSRTAVRHGAPPLRRAVRNARFLSARTH